MISQTFSCWSLIFLHYFVTFSICQCPCSNGGSCLNDQCVCTTGWTGKQCQRPCVDFYKSCKLWYDEGRCEWAKGLTTFFLDNCPVTCDQCTFDPRTAPAGLPLPPILEPLKMLVGVWQTETTFPDRYPVGFSSGGYREIFDVAVAEVPAFDTPSLNYTVTAVSLQDETDSHSEVGFIWMKPGKGQIRLIGNMITTNTGLTVIQEGRLEYDVIYLNTTTYSQFYDPASNPTRAELNVVERTLDFSDFDKLTQTVVKQANGRTYTKIYKRID